jgi:hypothetical protein
MSPVSPEVPEADALEQAQAVDALEQAKAMDEPEPLASEPPGGEAAVLWAGTGPTVPRPRLALEVPEADALDQAREVPLDDDRR